MALKIAVLSDIHGNIAALDAALADAKKRKPDRYVIAGDLTFNGPRPGDVIAWRHEVPKPGNTGHVVIVDQAPVQEEDGLVRMVYIDSTTLRQDGDSRPDGVTGVGRGTMWFKVDENGHPTAHIRGSRDAEPKAEAISIGRALRTPKKSVAKKAA